MIPILTNAMDGLNMGANSWDATTCSIVDAADDLIKALALLLCKKLRF